MMVSNLFNETLGGTVQRAAEDPSSADWGMESALPYLTAALSDANRPAHSGRQSQAIAALESRAPDQISRSL